MNVTKTAIRLPFAGLVVCAALAVSEQDARAQAISAGCSELNSLAAGAVDIPIGGASTGLPTSRSLGGSASFAFNAGDSFTIQFTSTSIAAAIDVDLSLVDGGEAKFARVLDSFTAAGQVRTVTVATTADGPGTFAFGFVTTPSSLDVVSARFLGCSAGAQQDGQTRANAQAAILQSVGLTLGRTRALVRGGPSSDGRATAPANPQAAASLGDPALSAGRGASGQGGETPIGVWADFAWTGAEDNGTAVDSNTNAFTLAGGLDAELAPGIIFGASVSVGRALSEAGNDALKTTETSVNVSPYVAYQIDDRFSVQGVVGYGYGSGDTDRIGVTGDYDAHRFYVAAEGALFETWGDAALYAGVGVLWGRSNRLSFTESDGTRVGGQQVDVGTASVIVQPSYMMRVNEDEGLFVEPFATVEYGYDFALSKIAGAANDRDAFRVGGGANLFGGDAVSGTIEATRMLGREDQDQTTARATVRVDF